MIKFLLVAPYLSDEFVKDCGLEYELNLSLITAGSLKKITEGFKSTKHKSFPHNLLLRDVLIQEDRVLKVLSGVEGLSGEGVLAVFNSSLIWSLGHLPYFDGLNLLRHATSDQTFCAVVAHILFYSILGPIT